jgi:hypothetical protein
MIRQTAITATALAVAVVAFPGTAQAKFAATGSGSPAVAATTMRNASAPAAICFNASGQRIGVTWTASPDTWVVSYLVKRTGNAPGANVTFAPVAYGTNFFIDTPPRTNVGDAYTYTIQSVINNWITPTITTPTRTYTTAGQPCT